MSGSNFRWSMLLPYMFGVLLILGIAAADSLTKVSESLKRERAREGARADGLSALRAALAAEYADTKGKYPADLRELVPKYLPAVPSAKVPGVHPDSAAVHYYWSFRDKSVADEGGWGYVNNPADPEFGRVFVNCTHTDAKGVRWDHY